MSEAFCSACKALGSGWEVHDDILPDVNVARNNLFRLTWRSDALPPNQDGSKDHIARRNYPIAIHRRCLERFINTPSALSPNRLCVCPLQ